MQITSSAFDDKGPIPTRYTCEGDDISPALSWQDIPKDAKSLVLIVDDPDAPSPLAPKMVWIHWILFNLPPQSTGLKENIKNNELPQGTLVGTNSWRKTEYGGPCPPIGRHRYFHKLFALDIVLEDLKSPTVETLMQAMQDHILATATVMGTYEKVNKE